MHSHLTTHLVTAMRVEADVATAHARRERLGRTRLAPRRPHRTRRLSTIRRPAHAA